VGTAMEVYELIKKMFERENKPVALWKVYFELKGRYTENQIRFSLRWLFEHGYLEWEKEGALVPVERGVVK